MKHYPHLIARIFNAPLMVAPEKARIIVSALAPRLGVSVAPLADLPAPTEAATVPGAKNNSRKPYDMTESGIAVISVVGTLAHNAATASPPSGMTVYGEIEDHVMDAITDPSVRGVLLDIDSPGGEASDSAFALADLIREARSVKPIWAVADESALSAAYLIGSAAAKLFAPEAGYVGSIGAYALHLDQSEFDKKEGLKWTFIKAGAHKTDGNPHEPLPDDMRARLQEDIDRVYARFVRSVGLSRPDMGEAGALATEARYYRGAEAMRHKLIDGVMSFGMALDAMNKSLDATVIPMRGARIEAAVEAVDPVPPISPEAASEEPLNPETVKEYEKMSGTAAPAVTPDPVKAERERVSAIYALAAQWPGHQALADEMAADPTKTAGDLSIKLLEKQKAKGADAVHRMATELPKAPEPAPVAPSAGPAGELATSEIQRKQRWDSNPALRAFHGSFENYEKAEDAYERANQAGLIRVLNSPKAA